MKSGEDCATERNVNPLHSFCCFGVSGVLQKTLEACRTSHARVLCISIDISFHEYHKLALRNQIRFRPRHRMKWCAKSTERSPINMVPPDYITLCSRIGNNCSLLPTSVGVGDPDKKHHSATRPSRAWIPQGWIRPGLAPRLNARLNARADRSITLEGPLQGASLLQLAEALVS